MNVFWVIVFFMSASILNLAGLGLVIWRLGNLNLKDGIERSTTTTRDESR